MIIKSLNLQNFRCFKKIHIDFDDRLTLLIGKNGTGKTTILEAIVLASRAFFNELSFGTKPVIDKNGDIREEYFEMGKGNYDVQQQYPCEIAGAFEIENNKLSLVTSIKAKAEAIEYSASGEKIDIAKQFQARLSNGDASLILPIIAFYWSGRLWKPQHSNMTSSQDNGIDLSSKARRTNGYVNCFGSEVNENQMKTWFSKLIMKQVQLNDKQKSPELKSFMDAVGFCLQKLTDIKQEIRLTMNFDIMDIEIQFFDRKKHLVKMPLSKLSDGMRGAICLVADIASRMSILNPQLGDRILTETPGIVLIDEIDLHLHPTWQQSILAILHEIFPKVQFIATTHAPAIINSVHSENMRILKNNTAYQPIGETFGKDTNLIISGVMEASERPLSIKKLFQQFNEAIDKKELSEAETILEAITSSIGSDDVELSRCRTVLSLEKFRRGK